MIKDKEKTNVCLASQHFFRTHVSTESTIKAQNMALFSNSDLSNTKKRALFLNIYTHLLLNIYNYRKLLSSPWYCISVVTNFQ
jgi:hypothetical protein